MLVGNAAYIPTAYESIATATGTGSSAEINFSSIPTGFKHLQIRGILNDGNANDIRVRANTDTANNYSWHQLSGNGSVTSASGGATAAYIGTTIYANYGTNIMTGFIMDILDYGSTSKYKTFRFFAGNDQNGSGQVYVTSGLWQSTSAINAIRVYIGANAFTTSTTLALYGIKEF